MTTSIPESAHSGRNWDYRYCWLRDAFFVVRALNSISEVGTMEDYLRWLLDRPGVTGGGCLGRYFSATDEGKLPCRRNFDVASIASAVGCRYGKNACPVAASPAVNGNTVGADLDRARVAGRCGARRYYSIINDGKISCCHDLDATGVACAARVCVTEDSCPVGVFRSVVLSVDGNNAGDHLYQPGVARGGCTKPEIADYAFTTLVPNLGIVSYRDNRSFVMADIPGIIEGASKGKGLGIRFLRHIERNSVLLFLVPADTSRSIRQEYEILLNELEQYNPELMHKPRILAVSKSDMLDDELIAEMKKELPSMPYVFISSACPKGLA